MTNFHMSVDTNSQKIQELLARGVDEVIVKEDLEKKLKSGKQLRIKLGIDPTSPNLHVGRAIPLLKLCDFQELGHQVVFIVGGGVALLKASNKLKAFIDSEKVKANDLTKQEILVGYQIVLKALEAPLRQIVINAGKDDGSVIVEAVRNGKGNFGYDAKNDLMVNDMISAGIVDPVKVTRSGLQNASSAVAILLTTEVAIADDGEDKKDEHSHGAPQMGY
jgi:chaperonin GroEL (HSP60 family)